MIDQWCDALRESTYQSAIDYITADIFDQLIEFILNNYPSNIHYQKLTVDKSIRELFVPPLCDTNTSA